MELEVYYDTIRFKFMCCGSKDIDEVIERLESMKQMFIEIQKIGIGIEPEDSDDYMQVIVPKDKVTEYCKVTGMDEKDFIEMNEEIYSEEGEWEEE